MPVCKYELNFSYLGSVFFDGTGMSYAKILSFGPMIKCKTLNVRLVASWNNVVLVSSYCIQLLIGFCCT